MRFTKNPNYWQTGKPYLDEIVVNVRKDGQALIATSRPVAQPGLSADAAGLHAPQERQEVHGAATYAGGRHVPDPAERDRSSRWTTSAFDRR